MPPRAPAALPGLPLWACSWDGSDGRRAILLPAAAEAQLERDAAPLLPGFMVDGRLHGVVAATE